jgi:hypothetical protein
VTLSVTLRGLALTAILSLAVAAPAFGVPAGDEYLPQVPSATGDEPVSEAGAAGGSSSSRNDPKKDARTVDEEGDEEASGALALGSGGGDDDSGGVLDTLLDPIVLLLIAGVLTIAIGMLLARRQNGDSPDPSRARRKSSDAPLTPDGEIISGPERP